jgi:thiol-disulfide isomerase/thioredoxin/DNA-binding beta-propeller fold protein YncE
MSQSARVANRPGRPWAVAFFCGVAALAVLGLSRYALLGRRPQSNLGDAFSAANREGGPMARVVPTAYHQAEAPRLNFEGGIAWINSGPIRAEELRGKIVLLDFWTFCCINCHHILPHLAKLEAKYPNELVVIGVHSAKFDAERDTENIRRKVREYRIMHPVVNDADMTIWRRYGVNSWPTLALFDANGRYVGSASGEGESVELAERAIEKLIELHRSRGELNETTLKFSAEMERSSEGPLLFPGKVLADAEGGRLFISDTGHNRIIQTDLEGKNPVVIGDGGEGLVDGPYTSARFNRPQGMCLDGQTLYVADTENHAIRAIDLGSNTVSTISGIGSQSPRDPRTRFSANAKGTALSSPWDLIQVPGSKMIYIAMAGPHEIWTYNPESGQIGVYAGSGYENIQDGPLDTARFAQPSGLATDGRNLFVADSEVSGVREIPVTDGDAAMVKTVVGQGLFEFGDRDGSGPRVRLQHCLGLAYNDGKLYIADTYNNKVKVCDPTTKTVKTFSGTGEAGESDNPPRFYEPGGLSAAGGKLYVADSNNHKIRVIDLASNAVSTLALEGLTPPRPAARKPSFPNAKVVNLDPVDVAPGNEVVFNVTIPLPKGYKFNPDVPTDYLVETPDKTGLLGDSVSEMGTKVDPPTERFEVRVPLAQPGAAGETLTLRISAKAFICSDTSSLCTIRSFVWNVPVAFKDGAAAQVDLTASGK